MAASLSARLVTHGVLFIASIHAASSGDCDFPAFMTRRSHWESDVTEERISIGAMWRFPASNQLHVQTTAQPSVASTFDCVSAIDSEIFLTRVSGSYQCLRFIRRSDFVVQLARSGRFDSASADECRSSSWQLLLEDSVLVSPKTAADTPGEVLSCGIGGGFWLSLIDSAGASTCRESFLRPIIEADCLSPGEGVLAIDFRQLTCAKPWFTGTITSHQLVCLGSWTQSGFVYSVLTDSKQAIMASNMWMLRIPARSSGPITAHVLTSITTDSAHNVSAHHHALSLTPASFPTLCENEATGCSASRCTDDQDEVRCQKTCDACALATGRSTCQFDGNDLGQWLEVSHRYAASEDGGNFVTVCIP